MSNSILLVLFSVFLIHTTHAHKIVAYWGQNGCYAEHRDRAHWEKDLMEFCVNYNYDTIVLSFLNVFFDAANKDNMPGNPHLILTDHDFVLECSW